MSFDYDYIITGAGCSGLSLAYQIAHSTIRDKKILLLDKLAKNQNDRTWCFWESAENWYEPIVSKKWDKLRFYGDQYQSLMDIAPFQYKMIKGIDFYEYILKDLKNYSNITFRQEAIQKIEDLPQIGGARVITGKGTYTASIVFNSILFENISKTNHQYIAQHFKGWVIQTEEDHFHPDQATLMDFRIPQEEETRFVYILPTDTRTAMIEATVFSNKILEGSDYENIIKHYIDKYLNIKSYKILHEEFGIIPMTDHPFKSQLGKNIIQIGKPSGKVKPSSGYAFVRIQNQVSEIIKALQQNKLETLRQKAQNRRFLFYDSLILNVMLNKRIATVKIFTPLFKKNNPGKILKFLNEQTNIFEEIFILTSCPWKPFLQALRNELMKKLFKF